MSLARNHSFHQPAKYNSLNPSEARRLQGQINSRSQRIPVRTASVLQRPRAPPPPTPDNGESLSLSLSLNQYQYQNQQLAQEKEEQQHQASSLAPLMIAQRRSSQTLNRPEPVNKSSLFTQTLDCDNRSSRFSISSSSTTASSVLKSQFSYIRRFLRLAPLKRPPDDNHDDVDKSLVSANDSDVRNRHNHHHHNHPAETKSINLTGRPDELYEDKFAALARARNCRSAFQASNHYDYLLNHRENLYDLAEGPARRHGFVEASDKFSLSGSISRISLDRSQSPPVCPPPPGELLSMGYLDSAASIEYSNYDEFTHQRNIKQQEQLEQQQLNNRPPSFMRRGSITSSKNPSQDGGSSSNSSTLTNDYKRRALAPFRFSFGQPNAVEYDLADGSSDQDANQTILSDTSTLHGDAPTAATNYQNKCEELERTVESLKNKLIAKEKELTDLQLKKWSVDFKIEQLEKENSQLKAMIKCDRVNL